MAVRPLRKTLSIQAAMAAILPFMLVVLLIGLRLYPNIRKDVENHQVQLATTVATQIESHLTGALNTVASIAALQAEGRLVPGGFKHVLNIRMFSPGALTSAYIAGPDGRVREVALAKDNEDQRQDLLGIDLSNNPLFRNVVEHRRSFWSDAFLSVVGGGLSVAYGMPSGDMVVVGEIDLGALTEYLKRISTVKEQLILVVDRRGQVIADQQGQYTAQQLNLKNIDIVSRGLNASESTVGDFNFAGHEMIGSIVQTGSIDWHVLVAVPEKLALRQMMTTIGIFVASLLVTAFFVIAGAVYAARKLAQRFETIAAHARSVTDGKATYAWPHFSIREFDALSSDLKQMADSIQEREAYNRVLFSDSPVPLLVIDGDTRRCVDGNEAALGIFTLSQRRELLEKSFLDLSADIQNEGMAAEDSVAEYFATCLADGFSRFEWTFENPDGGIWYGDVSMSLFEYGQKQFVQLSMQDITERRQAQEEREKLQAQFQQAQRLESVGRLAGGVAHDLNNLLSPILGYGELIRQNLPEGDQNRKFAQEVVKVGMRARDVVHQLLAFSRKQTMEFKPLDLNEVLDRFQSLLRRTIREDIDIQMHLAAELPLIKGDNGQLEQVVMNLAVNAQDAMPDGGVLSLTLSVVELDAGDASLHEEIAPGFYVLLTVSDTGQGISPDAQKKIFEPFFTTKEVDKGTGLGLATAYGIIKQHGGSVRVYSEPGQGAVFNVYLPVTDEAAVPMQAAAARPADSELRGSASVLLVEDNHRVREMTRHVLKKYGYDVYTATNGEEALTVLEAADRPIDLLLTDVVMPGMNGKELFRRISAQRPEIKALYMSGYTRDVIAHRGVMDAGINFINKPFSIDRLLIKIREVLSE